MTFAFTQSLLVCAFGQTEALDKIDCNTYEIEDIFLNNESNVIKVYNVCAGGKIFGLEDPIMSSAYQTNNIQFPDFFFENAQFRIYPTGGSGFYNYSAGEYSDYIKVDDNGVVTMIKEYDLDTYKGKTLGSPSIIITDEETGNVGHYKLEIGTALNGIKYFIDIDTSKKVSWDEAIEYCHSKSKENGRLYHIPHSILIHNGVDSSDGSEVRLRHELFGEYGNMTLYYPELNDDFIVWTRQMYETQEFGVPIDLTNGSILHSNPHLAYPMCMTLTFVHQDPLERTTTTTTPATTTTHQSNAVLIVTIVSSAAAAAIGTTIIGSGMSLYNHPSTDQSPDVTPQDVLDIDLEDPHYDTREVYIGVDELS